MTCTAQAAADVKIYGNVATGLYFSHQEGGKDSLAVAAFKQTPMDTYFGLQTKETFGNGWYAGAQLETGYHVDTGKLTAEDGIADRVARVFIGNEILEVSAGRLPNFTCATAPYSFYGRMRANQTRSGMLGPAPAFISYNTGSLDNTIAMSSNNSSGFVYQAMYSNGNEEEETAYDWADNRHVGQVALGWVGERLRLGTVLSYERFSHVVEGKDRKDDAMGIHLIASYDMSPLTISGIVYLATNERRIGNKTGLDVLQSQINPHFLYNTLDSVVWMTENGRTQEAVVMLTALARFFRISLSKGSNIIPIGDEIEHARNYLTIQKMRYKNKFSADISVEPGVEKLYTIKLIIQPILENAIYHGMEYADGDGEIHIRAFREEETVVIEVEDNGPGMSEEIVEQLLKPTRDVSVPKAKGSGIGFRNVHQRIQLTFGSAYGLTIRSEPDNGTVVRICLPVLEEEDARKYRKEGER